MKRKICLMFAVLAVVLGFSFGSVGAVGVTAFGPPCGKPGLESLSVTIPSVGTEPIPVSTGLDHTVNVPNSTTFILFAGTSLCCNPPFASFSISGDTWLNISPSGAAAVTVTNLQRGNNNLMITVTCGGYSVIYTITIIRARPQQSDDATLSYLNVNPGTLIPVFDPDEFNYKVTVAHYVNNIVVDADANCPNYDEIQIYGYDNLAVGPNIVTVTVTAQDGTQLVYTVTVYRELSNNASLLSLTVQHFTLSPAFNPHIFHYNLHVSHAVSQITVTALPNCSYATVSVTGHNHLTVGTNTVTITITAQDGTTIRNYTITVTRAPWVDDSWSSNGNDSSYTPTPPQPPPLPDDDNDNENENDNANDYTQPEPESFVFEIPPYSLSATFSGAALLSVFENYDYLILIRSRFSTSFSKEEISNWEFAFDSQIIMFLHSDVMAAEFASILARDPANYVLLKEFVYVTVVIDDEMVETYTTISVQIADLNLTDEELERLVGVWIDEATGEFVIIEGVVSEDGQTFSFNTVASGVFGIMLVMDVEPVIAPNVLVFNENSPVFKLGNAFFLAYATPFIDPETDRMMVPLRNVTNALGVGVNWDDEARAVLILFPYRTLTLEIDRPLPGGYGVPVIVDDRTFVPLRFVMEAFGAAVEWDADNQSAIITW